MGKRRTGAKFSFLMNTNEIFFPRYLRLMQENLSMAANDPHCFDIHGGFGHTVQALQDATG